MLGWLAAAAAPILIHFWSRRKYREMSWAAMEYLLAAVRRQTRRTARRAMAAAGNSHAVGALVVLAVAEPYMEQAGLASAAGGHAHRVLVLDGSYSMAYKPTDKTRFDRAKELGPADRRESPQGDALTLVLMASPPRVVVGTAALEPARSRARSTISNSRRRCGRPAGHGPDDSRVVERGKRENPRLAARGVLPHRHAASHLGAEAIGSGGGRVLATDQRLAQLAVLFVIDLGQPKAENLAVTDLRATDP